MIKHAILATDLSKATDKIIESSLEFKKLGIEKINLVHVLNLRNTQVPADFTIESLEKRLEDQRMKLLSMGFDVDASVTYGIPVIELEKKVKETGAGLIIIGSHGLSWSEAVLGSTASELLHNMKYPVLLVVLRRQADEEVPLPQKNIYQYEMIMKQLERKEPVWELSCKQLTDHILLPVDFSDFSEKAFQWIKDQSVNCSKLTLMHIQDENKIQKYLEDKLEEFNKIDTERLQRLKDSFKTSHPETEINIELKYGKPFQLILKFIKDKGVTLTVMGSQGRGFISEIFLGSLSHQVARHSDSHVLLVPLPRD